MLKIRGFIENKTEKTFSLQVCASVPLFKNYYEFTGATGAQWSSEYDFCPETLFESENS